LAAFEQNGSLDHYEDGGRLQEEDDLTNEHWSDRITLH